jgi:hypothetical protein
MSAFLNGDLSRNLLPQVGGGLTNGGGTRYTPWTPSNTTVLSGPFTIGVTIGTIVYKCF